MSEHTPEPWKCEGHVVYFPNVAGGFSLRDCPGAVATARRIVACVNACEGMADPAAEIADLKSQRDEMLEAAKAVVARWDTPNWKDAEPTAAVIGRLMAIISKCNGSA